MQQQVEAHMAERKVVSVVWTHIEHFLTTANVAEQFVRNIGDALPNPATINSQELPQLAKLHVSSSCNLMATLKMLAPEAFAVDPLHPKLCVLDDMEPSLLAMASTLIELQLFHLKRAATLTAHSRHRLAQRAAGMSASTCSLVSYSSLGASSSCCSAEEADDTE